jgi:hypothetical protein
VEILKGFKIGRTNAAAFRRSSKTLAAVLAVFEGLDSKQLLETRELTDRLPIGGQHFRQHFATGPALTPYRIKVPGINSILWGSRRTIAELRRRLKHENL